MGLTTERQHRHAEQRAAFQIERVLRELVYDFGVLGGWCIDYLEWAARIGVDDLQQLAVFDCERSAQHFMPAHHVEETLLERLEIEQAFEIERHGNIVSRARAFAA